MNQEAFAFDALRMVERALVVAPDRNLYSLRAISALTLGDHDRVLESSRMLTTYVQTDLENADIAGTSITIQELARMRQDLSLVRNGLRSGLVVADPERIRRLVDDVSELIETIDDYPSATNN